MPGKTPNRTPELEPPQESTGPSLDQDEGLMGLQQAGGGGNSAALAACGWRASGNLIGNPPVRDPCSPPNIGIVEDQAVYGSRRRAAEQTLGSQRVRADAYVTDGEVSDHRYWFAKVYSYVTEGELAEAAAGTFFYPSYVMESVRYFDKIYADNADAWDAGGSVEDHWQQAFETAADSSGVTWEEILGTVGGGGIGGGALALATGANPIAMVGGAVAGVLAGDALAEMYIAVSNLVVSMKAHIRYDLPRAEAWVFNTHYAGMQDAEMSNFQIDFNNMGPVFDRAGARMNQDIQDLTGVPVTWMPQLAQDLGMTYWFDADMASERADTWMRAEELVNGGGAGSGPYTDINGTLTGDTTSGDNMSLLDQLPANLRPDMDTSAELPDDNLVREETTDQGIAGIAQKPTSERIRMVRGAIRGFTFDGDEDAILTILRASIQAGDIEAVIGGANAWELLTNTHGSQYTELKAIMQEHYYPVCPLSSALALAQRCIDGVTPGWQQAVIADLVCLRSDGRTLISQIGGGDFDEGLSELAWQLSGEHQERVEAIFGSSSSWW